MATLEFELGPQTLAAMQALTDALNRFPRAAEPVQAEEERDPSAWMSARDFCERYRMGRTTLLRRVEQGMAEKRDFGPKTPRFRWAEGYGDRR